MLVHVLYIDAETGAIIFNSNNMGWFDKAPAKVSTVAPTEEVEKPRQYLEDLPPKFDDTNVSPPPSRGSMYKDAIQQFNFSDLSISSCLGMPCFRESMLTGFEAMAVLGLTTFVIHKRVNKSINCALGGFFLGSTVGWEQCRSIRRKSAKAIEEAKEQKLKKSAERQERNS